MRIRIDKNLEIVYSANRSHLYSTIEIFGRELCKRLINAGLIEDEVENYGTTISDATYDQLIANVCAVLCECLNVQSITSDIFDAFRALVLMGEGECPVCGGSMKYKEAVGYEIPSGLYDVPNSWERDYIIYECPLCGETIKSKIEL